jgi:hypothetical protein
MERGFEFLDEFPQLCCIEVADRKELETPRGPALDVESLHGLELRFASFRGSSLRDEEIDHMSASPIDDRSHDLAVDVVCPVMNRRASVLWMPPGADRFCSRQTWGRRVVAYRSQFLGADDRAHAGQAKIKSRLIGDSDPDEWDVPPKPKWMRWRTYNRYVERYDAYDDILDQGIVPLIAKLMGRLTRGFS